MNSHVFHRNAQLSMPVAVGGRGCYITDAEGRDYLDASGGAAVSCLGHAHPKVIAALHAQLDRLAYAHTSFFTSEPAEQLADTLIAHAPGGLDKVYLVSGGSESVEAALKLARQYFTEIGAPQRQHIIARRQSYHGNTLGALASGGNAWRRAQFAPLLIETSHIDPCYAYRGQRADETEEEYGLRMADQLAQKIEEIGADRVMAFIAEPVVGATSGAVPAARGYFKRIREICDHYGVLLILDEVMCGMGRTGSLFAATAEGVSPDILCIAKGLGAGYQPIGAMLASARIFDAVHTGSGFFQHGHTYLGHPMAAAAANAVLDVLIGDGVVEEVNPKGAQLRSKLGAAFGQHPHVGDIRGRGLFQALELVQDRGSKTPFDPALKLAARLKKTAQANGLLCYPMSGTIDGKNGDHILLAPPFILQEPQMDELVSKLAQSLGDVLSH